MLNINDLFPLFASLIGFPAFVAAGVNASKYFGLLQDTQAPKVVFWVNILGFVAVAVLFFTGRVEVLQAIDEQLGSLALFLLTFVSFISQLGLAKVYNVGLRGTPVIGKSFSQEDELEVG